MARSTAKKDVLSMKEWLAEIRQDPGKADGMVYMIGAAGTGIVGICVAKGIIKAVEGTKKTTEALTKGLLDGAAERLAIFRLSYSYMGLGSPVIGAAVESADIQLKILRRAVSLFRPANDAQKDDKWSATREIIDIEFWYELASIGIGLMAFATAWYMFRHPEVVKALIDLTEKVVVKALEVAQVAIDEISEVLEAAIPSIAQLLGMAAMV